MVWMMPIQLAVSFVWLAVLLGPAFLVSVAVMLIFFPLQAHECAVEKKRKDGDGKVAPSIPMNVDWALHQPYLDRLFFKQTDRFPAGSQDHRDAYDFIQRWTQYRSDPAQRSAAAAAVAGRPLCLRPPQAEAGGLRLRAPATRVDTVGGCTCGGGVGTVDT